MDVKHAGAGRWVIAPKGILVGDSAEAIKQSAAALVGQGVRYLVVDCSGVQLANSDGLTALEAVERMFTIVSGQVVLTGLSNRMTTAMKMMHMYEPLEIRDSVEEALAFLATVQAEHERKEG